MSQTPQAAFTSVYFLRNAEFIHLDLYIIIYLDYFVNIYYVQHYYVYMMCMISLLLRKRSWCMQHSGALQFHKSKDDFFIIKKKL